MKQLCREFGLAVVLGMIMPGLIMNIVSYSSRHHMSATGPLKPTTSEEEDAVYISVLMAPDQVVSMELETYLVGVVLAEMPASFEVEALKAQAVVARTYALRAHQGKRKHQEGSVCVESACCQAFRDPEDYLANGGTPDNLERVRQAVYRTEGEILLYQGELIEATYFSCSGGRTEDAVAVWGTEIPYLQAVESPGEEDATYFTDEMTLSKSQLAEILDIPLPENNATLFQNMTYTDGGGVATLRIGETIYTGTQIRKLLGLRSTAFKVTVSGDSVTFQTRGYGHRVGMSQYGADAMALAGNDYTQILAHYYQGTTLQIYTD